MCNFVLVKRLFLHILAMSALLCGTSAVMAATPAQSGASATASTASTAPATDGSLSYAWRFMPPLGNRIPATIDTLMLNYSMSTIPSLAFGQASAITGNFGTEGIDMTYFTRPEPTQFMFDYTLLPYLPDVDKQIFYNTRVPMTLVGYETGGSKEVAQDRLHVTFSGNINRKAQVGAFLDYLYSKGYYANQSMKDFVWGANGSYMGDHYEMQAAFTQYNSLNKENGGITDDLYILDPEEVQGGSAKVSSRNIPVNLSAAHTRLRGVQILLNNRYKLGFHRTVSDPEDSVETKVFVPVTAFSHTISFRNGYHMFRDDAATDASFWQHHYITPSTTLDETNYWTLDNTVGVSLLEGFSRWSKFGLSAFMHHQVAKYSQTPDTIQAPDPALTPYPLNSRLKPSEVENRLYVGARLDKRLGAIIRYNAEAELGLIGRAAGELKLKGELSTKFRLRSDSVQVRAYGSFANVHPSYFMRNYLSNHFVWRNDFGKTRKVRFGGSLDIDHTGTSISAGVENVQNLIYFNSEAMPVQHAGNIQVFSATLDQKLSFGIWNWDNTITYQAASNSEVLRLPALSVYSNMYLLFRVATLRVQFGVDCDYMTRYKALAYQPATMSFYNQDEGIMVGNYPMVNAYINMKLSKVRFFVMCSHVNQGLFGGNNYFSTAHNPLNPRRFQFGLTVDFAN